MRAEVGIMGSEMRWDRIDLVRTSHDMDRDWGRI
jgi:hypothetical protein